MPVPLKDTPPIVLAVSKAVAVAALPVVEPDVPDTFPVTLPVKFPVTDVVVKIPEDGLKESPVSVSIPCVPVAPSTKVK